MDALESVAQPPPDGSARVLGQHVFLSYASRPDARLARQLEAFLERFVQDAPPQGRVLLERRGKRALVIVRDGSDFTIAPQPDVPPEQQLEREVRRHLETARVVLVLCSRGAARSKYVADEVAAVVGDPARVWLAVTEGVDPSGRSRSRRTGRTSSRPRTTAPSAPSTWIPTTCWPARAKRS